MALSILGFQICIRAHYLFRHERKTHSDNHLANLQLNQFLEEKGLDCYSVYANYELVLGDGFRFVYSCYLTKPFTDSSK